MFVLVLGAGLARLLSPAATLDYRGKSASLGEVGIMPSVGLVAATVFLRIGRGYVKPK